MPYKDRDKANASSRASYRRNHEKALAAKRRWRAEHPDYMKDYAATHRAEKRNNMLRWAYGITSAQYDELLIRQGGGCAICGATFGQVRNGQRWRLFVDHDKDTGAVRGILCGACNSAIGLMQHDSARLEKAIAYLDFPPASVDVVQLALLLHGKDSPGE